MSGGWKYSLKSGYLMAKMIDMRGVVCIILYKVMSTVL